MQLLSNFSSRVLVLAIMTATLVSCTPAAKKARYAERGERYFKAGEYDKAKIEYMNVLKIDQRDAKAFARLGAMWLDEGAPLRAGGFLVKAVELTPNDIDSHLKLARVYLGMGRAPDARKEAMTVLGKMPENGEALLMLVEASQKPEDLAATEEQLEKFPNKDNAYYLVASAAIAGKKSDIAGAEAALQRALAADPNLTAVHSALGTLYLAKKDLPYAGTELEQAANLSPARSTEKLRFAQFKVQAGAVDEAKTFLKSLTTKTPDFVPAWSALAKIANQEKKYDEALQLIQNVLSRDPENIDGRIVQADSWVAKHETKKAVDSLETLDRTYTNVPLIKYALARAYLQNNNANQALDELDQVVRLSPGFVDAVVLYAQLHLKNGDAQPAIAPLKAVVQASPGLMIAEVLLAEAYRTLGRFEEAATVLQEQIKRSPQEATPYLLLGALLKQQNKIEDARAAFEKAAEVAPQNPSSMEQLVDLDIAAKSFEAGHERLNKLLQKQPNSAAAYYLQGKLYVAENKLDLAQTALLKAIELDHNFTQSYDLLIPIYIRTNKLSEALNQSNAVLAKKPNDGQALLLSGLIYDTLKDYDKSRDTYEKLLALNPSFVPALNNLAYIYAEKLNDLNRAAELAQKARSLAPSNPAVLDTLGWITYKQGNYEQAADLIAQSAAKKSDSPEIQFHLGMANYMMGRMEAARAALEKAAGSAADFPGKDEARQRLALLGPKEGAPQKLSSSDLEALLKQRPNDPVALMRLGEAYEKEGTAAKAADAYERALKANPRLVAATMKLAQLNAGPLKDTSKALAYAKKARELAPSDAQVGAFLGRIAYQTGNFSWAYSLLQESARSLADDPTTLHDFAWAAYSLGHLAEAQEAMRRVSSVAAGSSQGDDAKRFLTLTLLDQANADPTPAEAEISKVLATEPQYVPALMGRAAIQLKRGDRTAAAATYTDVLRQFPDFAPAEKRLAAIYAEQPENVSKAYDLANRARKVLGDDPELSKTLGLISYQRKEFRRAAQLLQESARRGPLDPTSLYYLGMSQFQAGQKDDGKQALNASLQAGLQPPLAVEARRVLTDAERH